MKRNFHSLVVGSMARVGVVAGTALLIGGSPMAAGSAFAGDREPVVPHSAEMNGERIPGEIRQMIEDIREHLPELPGPVTGIPGPVNGWQ
ncbi:hypothetical protein [Streptomyces flaveolus]|uniref:hypothetical protein n=1 Tax=Streptomyces flaveolus TaxID=67297 RepID=UPI0036F7B66E